MHRAAVAPSTPPPATSATSAADADPGESPSSLADASLLRTLSRPHRLPSLSLLLSSAEGGGPRVSDAGTLADASARGEPVQVGAVGNTHTTHSTHTSHTFYTHTHTPHSTQYMHAGTQWVAKCFRTHSVKATVPDTTHRQPHPPLNASSATNHPHGCLAQCSSHRVGGAAPCDCGAGPPAPTEHSRGCGAAVYIQ